MKEEQKRKLIEKVDTKCKKIRFIPKDKIAIALQVGFFIFVACLLIYLLILVVYMLVLSAIPLPKEEQMSYYAVQVIAYLALGVSIMSFMSSFPLRIGKSTVNELVDWYYRKLENEVEEKERPLLKALIKMKCREFGFTLLDIYEENPTLFEDDILLKKLYEVL